MSDLYASALGTTVLQSRELPIREDPDELREEWQWNDTPYENRGWCVLESALSFEAVGPCPFYADPVPLLKTELHTAPSCYAVPLPCTPRREQVGRSTRHPEMKAAMDQIGQAKVYEVFTDKEPQVRTQSKVQGAHEIAKLIRRSKFTGKQDRDIVCDMFDSYQARIAEAGLFVFGKKHLKELLKGDLCADG